MFRFFGTKKEPVPEITATDLFTRLSQPNPPVLVDVRTPAEWNQGRIAGALHWPVLRLVFGIKKPPLPSDRPIVAICRSARRSVPAVRALTRRGYDASQLAGGMIAWQEADLPVHR